MALKILHTADVHLGAKFLGLGRRGPEQRAQLLETFTAVVDLALEAEVNLVMIAGDLFDSASPGKALVAQAASRIARLTGEGVQVCITPGTHDPYGPGGVYSSPPFDEMPGVHVFTSEDMHPVHLAELDCAVYGNANRRPFANKYPLAGLKPADDTRWRVGMVHASYEIPDVVEDTYIVTPDQIAACGLDYLALGHQHSLSDKSRGGVTAFYSGSPEMVRMQRGDFGSVLLVELDLGAKVTAVSVGRRIYEEVAVQAEQVDGAAGLVAALEGRADPDKVIKLLIEGLRRPGYPEVEDLVEELAPMFFSVSVEDRSWPAPATVDPAAYPADSPAGVYVRVLQQRLEGASESEEEQVLEAMQVGLSLLGEAGE